MMIYIQPINYNMWDVIEFGTYESTKVIKVDGKSDQAISEPKQEYDEEDKWKLSLNVRTKIYSIVP